MKRGLFVFKHMRLSLLVLILFLFGLTAPCQKVNMGEGSIGAGKVNWDDQFIILDKNGGSFHSYYDGVDGHPFYVEGFKKSTIKLVSGQSFSNVIARLDIFKQTVQIKLNGDTVRTILEGNIAEVTFSDTIQQVTYTFRTGYPGIDNLTRSNFYQVVSDGKVEMLKSSVKKINKLKNDMTGELTSQFDTYEDYYLYVKYEMKRLKKDKEYILGLLSDKRKQLDEYVLQQKINFKSIESIKKLIDYYNSFPDAQF